MAERKGKGDWLEAKSSVFLGGGEAALVGSQFPDQGLN